MPLETDEKACRGRPGDQRRPRERTPAPGPVPSEEQALPDYPPGVCAAPLPTHFDAYEFPMRFKCVPRKPSSHGWARLFAPHASYLPGNVLDVAVPQLTVPDARPRQTGDAAMRGDVFEKLQLAMFLLSGKLEGHRKIRLTLGYLGEGVCTEPPTEPNGKDAVADCHERSACDVSPNTVADPSTDRGSLPPKLRGRS